LRVASYVLRVTGCSQRVDDLCSNQIVGKGDRKLDHRTSRPVAVRSTAVKKEISDRIKYRTAVNHFVIENMVWSRPDDNASAGFDPIGRSFPAKRSAGFSIPMAKDDTEFTGARRLTDLFLEQV
jgi:hypothetical protein